MSHQSLLAGVLGGLGPEATVDFLARVVTLTPAERDQDHIRLLIEQNPEVPNRQDAILRGGESPAPQLIAMARRLADAGCDFLVMPCNTAHAWAEDIRGAVDVPLVSIVDVTVAALPAGATRIGLLLTPACVAARMYQDALSAAGRAALPGDATEIDELMQLVNRIKTGDQGAEVRGAMRSIADRLVERGADALLIGCTEIPLVLDADRLPVPVVSSTDALALETIALARGSKPLPGQ